MQDVSSQTKAKIAELVRDVMAALVARNDAILKPIFDRSRVERTDAFRVIDEYGGSFAPAPPQANDSISIIPIDGSESHYSIDAFFWHENAIQTDLSVEMTIELGSEPIVYIDDVRVM